MGPRSRFSRTRPPILSSALASLIFLAAPPPPVIAQPSSQAPTSQNVEFFEKKIRPLLAEHCYACHSGRAAVMSELRLDTREGLRKGGTRGPALVSGEPGRSLLLKVVSYSDPDLRMPPPGKLSDEQIADIGTWIEMGAPDPRTETSAPAPVSVEAIDFDKARQFWSFQPLRPGPLPRVQDEAWPTALIDHFILSRIEEQGLTPAPPADKRTLLRRVTFDLTGLPPTPDEIAAFLADDSPGAFETVVERLLDSPHYGERWGRHWLDLVRFAETNGHEFDNDKLDAWRYRDYVIRALNDDLPYDQFVREHIAGDLLPEPRLSPDGTRHESPIGTSPYWFGEVLNGATDSEKSRADQVDNQIDVMGKAFLGLTVACARCHDHKFDPIPTADYYSLAGIMHSTEILEAVVDSEERSGEIASVGRKIAAANDEVGSLLAEGRRRLVTQLYNYLLAAAELMTREDADVTALDEELAAAKGLDAETLRAWVDYLEHVKSEPENVFHPFAKLAFRSPAGEGVSFTATLRGLRDDRARRTDQQIRRAAEQRGDVVYEDFDKPNYDGWIVSGQAFTEGSRTERAPNQPLRGYRSERMANSFGAGSDAFVGSLISGKFHTSKRYIHVRIAGSRGDLLRTRLSQTRLTLVVDGYKSSHFVSEGTDDFVWMTRNLVTQYDRTAYFELVDRDREGHIVVDKIIFSDSSEPPDVSEQANPRVLALLDDAGVTSLASLARAYQRLFQQAIEERRPVRETRALLASLTPTPAGEGVARLLNGDGRHRWSELAHTRGRLEGALPPSTFAMTSRDDNPRDVAIHLRGSHKNLGEMAPRGFLQVLSNGRSINGGSGRLELARQMTTDAVPLLARVMVNRIWKHHFGQGLVRSTDNFGETGDRPSHPELLDYLAGRFQNGWSIKAMHRALLLSSSYRMSSRASARAMEADPRNTLLHHMPARRLEGESIRDAMLAVAGTLDRSLYGPSVVPHISRYQDGRGKPPHPGPLDGRGRRSVYIQVRRNFLTPLLLAFDYPLPISSRGRRTVSTVPSQALIMMNNRFVGRQAEAWARREIRGEPGRRARIESMFLRAYGRPVEPGELDEVDLFLDRQSSRYAASNNPDDIRVWTDLAHVLFNSTEFIFVR